MKKIVIINVNLEYEVEAKTDEEAIVKVKNIELPAPYVECSFELVKVFDVCPDCGAEMEAKMVDIDGKNLVEYNVCTHCDHREPLLTK